MPSDIKTQEGRFAFDPIHALDGTMITSGAIQSKVTEIAKQIEAAMADDMEAKEDAPLLVCILCGAIFFYKDLLTAFSTLAPCVGTIQAKSYAQNEKQSKVRIYNPSFDCMTEDELTGKIDFNLSNRRVILVDDVCDSGQTLYVIKRWFEQHDALKVYTATILSKPSKRNPDFPIDLNWNGFEIDGNLWVYGYGLDNNGLGRNHSNFVVWRKVSDDAKSQSRKAK